MGMAAGQRTTIHLWQILAGPGLPKLLLDNLCSELSYHLTAHWDESNLKGRTSNRERRWATPDWNWAAKLKSSCSHGWGGHVLAECTVGHGHGMREAGICQVAKGGIERRGASRIGWIDGERAQRVQTLGKLCNFPSALRMQLCGGKFQRPKARWRWPMGSGFITSRSRQSRDGLSYAWEVA